MEIPGGERALWVDDDGSNKQYIALLGVAIKIAQSEEFKAAIMAKSTVRRDVGTRVVDKHRNKQVPICNKQITDTGLVITKKETLRNKKAVTR